MSVSKKSGIVLSRGNTIDKWVHKSLKGDNKNLFANKRVKQFFKKLRKAMKSKLVSNKNIMYQRGRVVSYKMQNRSFNIVKKIFRGWFNQRQGLVLCQKIKLIWFWKMFKKMLRVNLVWILVDKRECWKQCSLKRKKMWKNSQGKFRALSQLCQVGKMCL